MESPETGGDSRDSETSGEAGRDSRAWGKLVETLENGGDYIVETLETEGHYGKTLKLN